MSARSRFSPPFARGSWWQLPRHSPHWTGGLELHVSRWFGAPIDCCVQWLTGHSVAVRALLFRPCATLLGIIWLRSHRCNHQLPVMPHNLSWQSVVAPIVLAFWPGLALS